MKLSNFKRWFMMVVLILGITSTISAQGTTFLLKGKVLDEADEPLIGASVMVPGTSNGVATDVDGNFEISVSIGNKLKVSYVGYAPKEVTVDSRNPLVIKMDMNTQLLQDVVVVGYGTMKKKDLTGAISQIDPAKAADRNPNTVQDLLKGIPGLKVGIDASAKGGGSLQLRGQNSVYEKGDHNAPLLIVDGMIFYGELSEINPEDIKQIDVLKDASSTAIYGARAASGVIIITTKNGNLGRPKVNLSANFGFTTKAYYRDLFTAEEQLQYRSDYYKSQTYGFNPQTGAYEAYQATDSKGNLIAAPGYYDHYSNASRYGLTPDEWGLLGTNPQGASLDEIYFRRLFNLNGDVSQDLLDNYLAGRTTDWEKNTFRTGFNQDYNISLSGATEKVNYYFSLGYLRNEGAIRGDNYTAFRGSAKINGQVTKWLEIGANINFQDRSDGNVQVGISENSWEDDQLRNSPYGNYRNEDGSYSQYPMGVAEKRGYNWIFNKDYYKLDRGYTVLNTILHAKVTLPLGFSYNFNISPRYQYYHNRYFMSAELPNSTAKDKGVDREWRKNFDWALNNTIQWDYTFNEKHHIIATVVQEAEENKMWSDVVNARNIQPVDNLGMHNTSNATITDSKINTTDTHFTADAWLGRLFYSFDDRYMITASVRRDGYCAFGQNNPHATFPSVAVAWNFTNEKFMAGVSDWFNTGKLRLSWGKNGNRSLEDPYISLANLGSGAGATMTYLDKNGSPVSELKYLLMDRMANPNLQWEKTTSYNVGLDLGFLNNRISASLDFYHKSTKDMIIQLKLPGFSGFSNIWSNIGQVDNTGFELAINTRNIETRNFLWTTSLGFSYNKNTIKHINYATETIVDGMGNIVSVREMGDVDTKLYIGHPIGEIWDYRMDGIWQVSEADEAAKYGQRPGDPKVANNYTADDVVNADGSVKHVYNDLDKEYLGCTNPPYFFNMRNDFKLWNNLSFGFSVYGYFGHKQLRGDYLNRENSGNLFTYGFNKFKHEYWTPENPTNEYARFESQGPSGVTSPGKIYNRSFLRFDNVSLGYSLPDKWIRKAKLEKVRFSFSVDNLFVIHAKDWKFGDPETGGLTTRNYNLGVQVTF